MLYCMISNLKSLLSLSYNFFVLTTKHLLWWNRYCDATCLGIGVLNIATPLLADVPLRTRVVQQTRCNDVPPGGEWLSN